MLAAASAAVAAARTAHELADIAVAEHNLAVRRALAGLGPMPNTDADTLSVAVTRAGLAVKAAELDERDLKAEIGKRYGVHYQRVRADGALDR